MYDTRLGMTERSLETLKSNFIGVGMTTLGLTYAANIYTSSNTFLRLSRYYASS